MPLPEPVRCLFVLPSFAGGGAERVTLQLARELPGHGLDCALLVLDGRGPLQGLAPNTLPTTILGRPRVRQALYALRQHLLASRPEVVFSSFDYLTIALALIRATLPERPRLVAREANLPSLALAGGPGHRLLRRGAGQAYRRCDAVIATSQRMAEELGSLYRVPPQRLHTLPNPVDEEGIRAAATALPHPGLPAGGGRLFVAAGRLVPQKGFDRLLRLWPRLPAEDRLVVLGDGPERERLQGLVAQHGLAQRVWLLPHVGNPWAWFARADALLLPSRFEGMPNVALESLACGTPVIATPEAGGIGELAAELGPAHVRVAPFGERFFDAVASAAGAAKHTPAPSRLPARFRSAQAAGAFADLIRHLPG